MTAHPALLLCLFLGLAACSGGDEREDRETIEARLSNIEELQGTISDDMILGYESRSAAPSAGLEDEAGEGAGPDAMTSGTAEAATPAETEASASPEASPGFESVDSEPADTD